MIGPCLIHRCPTCGAEFPSRMKMIGHMGGKHGSVSWGRKGPGFIEHGTRKGYLAHRRHKIDACRPCSVANAKYMASWRALRKAWKS